MHAQMHAHVHVRTGGPGGAPAPGALFLAQQAPASARGLQLVTAPRPAVSSGGASGLDLAAAEPPGAISEEELERHARREYLLIKQDILAAQQRELQREWAEFEARFGHALGSGPPRNLLPGRQTSKGSVGGHGLGG